MAQAKEEREQLKELVSDTLIAQGVLPKIKAQLRASVFQVLQQNQHPSKPTEISLLDELVYAYLRQKNHLPFACSVLGAESNLEKTKSEELNDISTKLGVGPGDVLPQLLSDFLNGSDEMTGTTLRVKKNAQAIEEKPVHKEPEKTVAPLKTKTSPPKEEKNPLLSSVDALPATSKPKLDDNYSYDFSDHESDFNESENFSEDFAENRSPQSEKSLGLDFNEDEFDIGGQSDLENSENFSDVTAQEDLEEIEGIDHVSVLKL